MVFVYDRSEAGELLERFAEFLAQGLPYGAASLAADCRRRFDPGATLSFMTKRFESGLVPCSALLEPLVDADLVDIVRRGEATGRNGNGSALRCGDPPYQDDPSYDTP